MIDVKTLRLGNKILANIGASKLAEVYVIPEILVDILNESPNNYFPVPLNAPILIERCGFTGNGFIESGAVMFKNESSITIARNYYPNGTFILHYKDVKVPVPSLHDLQNIFFCLFREELKIIS